LFHLFQLKNIVHFLYLLSITFIIFIIVFFLEHPISIPLSLQCPQLEQLQTVFQPISVPVNDKQIIRSKLTSTIAQFLHHEEIAALSLSCTRFEACGDRGTFLPAEDKFLFI
jgi:hypothetical protein